MSICLMQNFIFKTLDVFRHHMTPKVCMLLTTNEHGQQKYIEISQNQALALSSRGAVSIVQVIDNPIKNLHL